MLSIQKVSFLIALSFLCLSTQSFASSNNLNEYSYPPEIDYGTPENVGRIGVKLRDMKEGELWTEVDVKRGLTVFVPGSFRFNKKRTTKQGYPNQNLRRLDSRVVADVPFIAGALPGWRTGDDLCQGEESYGGDWNATSGGSGIDYEGEYTKAGITAYALNKAEKICESIGGRRVAGQDKIEAYEKRKLPYLRKCISAYVNVTCDVTSKTNDIKRVVNEVKRYYPNHPIIPELESFIKGL